MAEQLALDEFSGYGRAVHLHEGHGAAVALLVEIAGHQLLTGTVGAGYQDLASVGATLAIMSRTCWMGAELPIMSAP